jgi:hypothetical protein
MCVLVTTVENFQLLTPFCNTDAPESRYDHNDNRSHPDAPLSSRLCLRVPQRVRYALNFLFVFILLSVGAIISARVTLSSWATPRTRGPSYHGPQ